MRSSAVCVALVGLAAIACDDGFYDELPRVQVMAACVVPPGDEPSDRGFSDVDYRVVGVVTAVGEGEDDRGCFAPPKIGWGDGASDATRWLEVDDEKGTWLFAMRMPGLSLPGEGAEVSVDFHYEFVGFSPLIGNIAIADAQGTVAWIGRGGDVTDLTPPPPIQSVQMGDTVYREGEECGEWEAYEIDVIAQNNDVTLEYGEKEGHEDGVFYHGGFRHSTGRSNCADWYVADIELGWRRE